MGGLCASVLDKETKKRIMERRKKNKEVEKQKKEEKKIKDK